MRNLVVYHLEIIGSAAGGGCSHPFAKPSGLPFGTQCLSRKIDPFGDPSHGHFAAKSKTYESSGTLGNAVGTISVWGGVNVFFQLNFSNTSSQAINDDLNPLSRASGNGGTIHWTSGNPSGPLYSGELASVTFIVTSPDSDADQDVACTMLHAGAAPLMTMAGEQLQFRFWTSGDATTNQLINLCATDDFAITESTDVQNNATGNGFIIGLGGGPCDTENICIQVSAAT